MFAAERDGRYNMLHVRKRNILLDAVNVLELQDELVWMRPFMKPQAISDAWIFDGQDRIEASFYSACPSIASDGDILLLHPGIHNNYERIVPRLLEFGKRSAL